MRTKHGVGARHPRTSRGAALVESVLVFSVLILGLVGMVYFRELYLKKLGAQRMARAALVAHSMVGCKDAQPRTWLDRDGAGYHVVGAPPTRTNIPEAQNNTFQAQVEDQDSRAPSLLSAVGRSSGSTSDGKGILNPITDTRISRDVDVSTGPGIGRDNLSFQGAIDSKSFLSCGDEVKQGDYESIIDMIRDQLQGMNNAE